MNHNKLIAVGLILTIGVFLAVGCIGEGKAYKDCGTSSSATVEEKSDKCFRQHFSNCTPAKVIHEPQNLREGFKALYKVEGGEPGNCKLTIKILKEPDPDKKEVEGKKVTCTATGSKVPGLDGFISDPKTKECKGDVEVFKGTYAIAKASVKSKLKMDTAECRGAIYDSLEEPNFDSLGKPHEDICGDICSDWKNSDKKITEEAKNKGIENAYQACISGKTEWIK